MAGLPMVAMAAQALYVPAAFALGAPPARFSPSKGAAATELVRARVVIERALAFERRWLAVDQVRLAVSVFQLSVDALKRVG
jgi:hypothetical protein